MKKMMLLAVLICGRLFAQATPPDSAAFVPLDSLQQAIDLSLKALKMHRGDLTFRGDYLEEDTYRLPEIDTLMKEPLSIINYAGATLEFKGFSDIRRGCLDLFGATSRSSRSTANNADSLRLNKQETSRLGEAGAFLIQKLVKIAGAVDPSNWETLDRYSQGQRDSIVEGVTLLLEENRDDEFRSVDELDSIAQYEDRWAAQLVNLLDGLQGRGEVADQVLNFLETSLTKKPVIPPSAYRFSLMTDYGEIIIGDTTASHYDGDLFVVIDPGGNDTYDINLDGIGHQTYIIDYSGDDVYNFPRNRISPYFFGGSIIVDYNGDDTYDAGSFSLGSGLFGVGVLWDVAGNDKYFGDTFTQGAGCFGVGILRDDAGNDLYQGALFAQGFGFIDGIGVLIDSDGNDTYFAGGKYKDILRYKDHYLSLSQGFAYGIRPKMSAGVGLLIDRSGNDVYVSDIFGQGSSYWYGLGVLSDGGGNDQYISFQYAQGAATHMTLGILYDVSGDDIYSAKGVSQGCGHDRAAGILVDLDGNDSYNAFDLSQAAGSANGMGILADIRGADAYVVRSDQNTQGYGQPRRDYGSIGIFIDLGGKDGYAGGQGRDSTWWTDSKWGVGIDQ